MSATEKWTVGRLLNWTTDYFQSHGAESPRLDAEILLAQALGCRRIELYTRFDEEPNEQTKTSFREMVRRRAEGMPVAYLVGRREFYSLNFRVSPAVLIPRPETEMLVVTLLDLVKERASSEPVSIADIGTGSGILAVCAAKHLPMARVLALDISADALMVAQQNAADHGVADRVEFIESDLFAAVPDGRTFDFIVSNPPYVGEQEQGTVDAEVHRFEPHAALYAGPKGTEVIQRLVPEAAARLNPAGHLLIEVSPIVHDAALKIVEAEPRLRALPTIKDLARHPRALHAERC